jgi:predicted nuclease with TOPRIM domain
MTKQRKTVTLDPEAAAYLDETGRNASETVNHLVKQDMGTENENVDLLKLRLEQVQSERETLEARAEKKREEEQRLEARLERLQENASNTIADARDALDGASLTPKNPAVQNWADKANLSPEELIEEL